MLQNSAKMSKNCHFCNSLFFCDYILIEIEGEAIFIVYEKLELGKH